MTYRNRHQMLLRHPPRRRSRRWLLLVALFLMLLAAGTWAYSYYRSPGPAPADQFVVAPGEGVGSITARLKESGVVRSGWLFRQALEKSGHANRLQPGSYDLHGIMSYEELAERLTTGGLPANEFQVRLLEGWNLDQVAAALDQAGYPDTEAFTAVVGERRRGYGFRQPEPDWLDRYAFLADKPTGQSLEGYLFPDTYRFFRDASAGAVVQRLLENFDRRLSDAGLHEAIAASGRDYHEIVTMASIVEREVRGLEDQRRVADIFWKRLGIGMALQADSTVNYITDKGLAAVGADDLRLDSPYNTYKYRGLPPGPISNPGLSALRAAVDPLANEYWYFLTDSSGQVHYARDFEEHKLNKARYLR